MIFTRYQTAVLRSVEMIEKSRDYSRLYGFLTGTVTNIIADGWKVSKPFKTTADKVVAYIKSCKK